MLARALTKHFFSVTCDASLKCVISVCLLVDKECQCAHGSSTRPPGVRAEPQQSGESSYSKHVGRPGMTHSDDSRTSIMCKEITSSDCGGVKSNRKRLPGRAEEHPSERDSTMGTCYF